MNNPLNPVLWLKYRTIKCRSQHNKPIHSIPTTNNNDNKQMNKQQYVLVIAKN